MYICIHNTKPGGGAWVESEQRPAHAGEKLRRLFPRAPNGTRYVLLFDFRLENTKIHAKKHAVLCVATWIFIFLFTKFVDIYVYMYICRYAMPGTHHELSYPEGSNNPATKEGWQWRDHLMGLPEQPLCLRLRVEVPKHQGLLLWGHPQSGLKQPCSWGLGANLCFRMWDYKLHRKGCAHSPPHVSSMRGKLIESTYRPSDAHVEHRASCHQCKKAGPYSGWT